MGEATAEQELGEVARLQGDPNRARELVEKSLIISREIGDHVREALSLAYLGHLHAYLGDNSGSRGYLDRFLRIRTVRKPRLLITGDRSRSQSSTVTQAMENKHSTTRGSRYLQLDR